MGAWRPKHVKRICRNKTSTDVASRWCFIWKNRNKQLYYSVHCKTCFRHDVSERPITFICKLYLAVIPSRFSWSECLATEPITISCYLTCAANYIHIRHNSNTVSMLTKAASGSKPVFTYLLNSWSTAFLEQLTGLQIAKAFHAFYGTRRFITAFTSVRHLYLSWASWTQSKPLLPLPEDPS